MGSVSEQIQKKIEAQRKLKGMTQAEFGLKMGKSSQWFTKLKQYSRDLKVDDVFKAGQVLDINPCYLLPDDILKDMHNENIEESIRTLTKKGYRIILEEGEKRGTKNDLEDK